MATKNRKRYETLNDYIDGMTDAQFEMFVNKVQREDHRGVGDIDGDTTDKLTDRNVQQITEKLIRTNHL